MRIAIFYSGYLPGEKYGGPVTSIYNFTELLGDDNELYIICTNHDLKETTPYSGISSGWNKVGKSLVIYLSDAEYGKQKFSEILDKIKPDLIYASSIFSATQTYPLFKLSKEKKIPLLLAPRGELNNDALSIKRFKKRAYLLLLKVQKKYSLTFFQATSEEEKKNILQNLGVDEKRIFLLPNVPALPVHKKGIEKQSGKLKMCFVGRLVENKNLLVALKALINVSADIEFDIFGPCEDKVYFKQCQQIIKAAPENIKITYKGALSPSQMKNAYSEYDCLISPTKFENYGQAIVEAMLHDVPVIISKGTTPWDDIEEKQAGYVVSISDISGFTKAIDTLAKMDELQYQAHIDRLRDYCSKKFDYLKLKEEYRESFHTMLFNCD